MKAIVAVDSNWGIGRQGKMLVHLPGDLKYFKNKTIGKVLVMGRQTLESLPGGNPLAGRTNIVMTRNPGTRKDIITCGSIEELADKLGDFNDDDIFVIGGGQIYGSLLPFCDRVFVTKIEGVYEADTFFPNLDNDGQWELKEASDIIEENGIKYTFCVYGRKDCV